MIGNILYTVGMVLVLGGVIFRAWVITESRDDMFREIAQCLFIIFIALGVGIGN